MAGEWSVRTLDQIKANQDGAIAIGPFGSRMKADRYVASGVPVIRGNNISDTRALVGDLVFVSEETADELRSSNVFPGDLVFPHRGAIGQVGIVPGGAEPRYVLSTSLMKLSCNRDLVDPLFVFYFFRSGQGRHALLQHASTVGTPGIGQPLTSLRSISLPVPPLPEQRAIAHILGTLDDKIELNRRMNESLEAMARALFKSWFVDFDPVRAKAEGRLPAGRQATPPAVRPGIWFVYALECDDGSCYIGHTEDVMRRFDEHASGKGAEWTKRHPPHRIAYWEELPTRDAAIAREKKLKTGSGREWLKAEILKLDVLQNGLLTPACLPPCLPAGRDRQVADLFPARLVDSELGEIPEGWEVRPLGDLLELAYGKALKAEDRCDGTVPVYGSNGQVGWHDERLAEGPGTVVGRKGNPGITTWAPTDFFVIDTAFYVVPKSISRSPHFLFHALRTHDLASLGADSAVPGLNRNLAYMSKQILPPRSLLERFDSLVSPTAARVHRLNEESRTLATLRDTLLPKLISGELRLKDAGRFVAEAAS